MFSCFWPFFGRGCIIHAFYLFIEKTRKLSRTPLKTWFIHLKCATASIKLTGSSIWNLKVFIKQYINSSTFYNFLKIPRFARFDFESWHHWFSKKQKQGWESWLHDLQQRFLEFLSWSVPKKESTCHVDNFFWIFTRG